MKTLTIAALTSGALVCMAASFAWPAPATESRIRLSTGIEYSSGRYGGLEDIEELYVPLNINLTTRRLGVSLSVPYIRVRAPTGTAIDGQAIPGEGDIATESGIGDVTATLTLYDLYYNANRGLALDVTGAIKLGTASYEKGLGTGEADYSLYLDAYKWFDAFTLFGSVGYRWRGEPDDVVLNDVFMAALGGTWPAGDKSSLGMVFDYREAALAGYPNVEEMTAFGSMRLREHWYLQIYAFAGFTDSSPDWGGGFTITTDVRPFPTRSGF